MRAFPLFVAMDDRFVLLVGGGEPITQKARLLTRTTAEIRLASPEITPELQAMVDQGRIVRLPKILDPAAFSGATLAVISTGCPGLDAVEADLARSAGALVNVVDRPSLSDVTMPALVDRDPVMIAIGTEGTAPVLGRKIKSHIESYLEPSLGKFATLAGGLRREVARRFSGRDRRLFWEWALDKPRRLFTQGRPDTAEDLLREVLATGEIPQGTSRQISIVRYPVDAPDLLTLRALSRLQSADVVIHGPEAPVAVLDLARRDADRVVISFQERPVTWGAERAARSALAAGSKVVWLDNTGRADQVIAKLSAQFEVIAAASTTSVMPSCAEDG